MTSRSKAPPTRRRGRLRLGRIGLCALLLSLVLAAGLAVETAPRAQVAAPDAAGARAALAASDALRAFVESGGAAGRLALPGPEIDALLAAAGRIVPGTGAAARLEPGGVALTVSAGPPNLPAPIWANLRLDLAAGPGGLRVERARLGRLPLPPALVEALAARGIDAALGAPGLGRAALAGVTALGAEDGRLEVAFDYDAETRRALIDQVRARLDLGGAAGPAFAYLWWFDRGGDKGALPRKGSVLPYLRYVVDRAGPVSRRWPEAGDRETLAAGFLALSIYCGQPAIGAAVGIRLKGSMRGAANHCAGATLGGRDDLKRHFIVSAALYAQSGAPAAFGVGEIKEILDSGAGGTGFSFDDMAANLAGARFAAAFLAVPRSEWPAMLALVKDESDVMPDVSGLPSLMSEAEFRERFGAVDSPAYRAMVAEIEARVAALPFHRALAGG